MDPSHAVSTPELPLGNLRPGLGVAASIALVAEPLLHLLDGDVARCRQGLTDGGGGVGMVKVGVVPVLHQRDGHPGQMWTSADTGDRAAGLDSTVHLLQKVETSLHSVHHLKHTTDS